MSNNKKLLEKQDFKYLAILISIALAIGIYLIITTVMISKDGVFYIERAQQLTSDPIKIIKEHPPGFPFLILAAHKFVSLFTDNTSNQIWIYSALGVTLFCRLLAIVPLYFIGKLLVGNKNSFLAILILIFLPYPAQFATDVVREWPHLLFLATSLLFVILACKRQSWWLFAIAGFIAGLGHTIRPECAQVVLYGIIWLTISLFGGSKLNMNRLKTICLMLILISSFLVPASTYMRVKGQILPDKLHEIIFYGLKSVAKNDISFSNVDYRAQIAPNILFKSFYELFKAISENLMHFFVLPMILGLCFREYLKNFSREHFFISMIVILYTVMMILLYIKWGYISKRHCFPIVVFTAFYIPTGLNIMGNWLLNKFAGTKNFLSKQTSSTWFTILFLIGVGICIPKLFRISRIEKEGYLQAVNWLKENTKKEDKIAAPDRRLYFYADRNGLVTEDVQSLSKQQADYFVAVFEMENKFLNQNNEIVFSDWQDGKKKKRIEIYRLL